MTNVRVSREKGRTARESVYDLVATLALKRFCEKEQTMTLGAFPRSLAVAALLGLLAAARSAHSGATPRAHAAGGNSGDIKISDTTLPAHGRQGNEPHVGCQFYVLGFNFAASSGVVTVRSWPPTGDGTVVLTAPYTGSATDSGTEQFTNGPYTLPAGHYKVDVTDNKGAEIAKHKVFWIDGCPATLTPTDTTVPATVVPTAVPTTVVSTTTPTETPVPTVTASPIVVQPGF